jgi:hypothetical protein
LDAKPWATTFLYRKGMFFIPRGRQWSGRPGAAGVTIKDIAAETFVMVPDACGLARATRASPRAAVVQPGR